jgi:hypothetical protein
MKVLIAAPIGGMKQYSINLWLEWIANQSYNPARYEVCLCVNGKDSDELAGKLKEVEIMPEKWLTKHIIVLRLPDSSELSVIQRITYSREMIRRYAVENDYDYIFFLDTDTIPAYNETIQMLMSWNKDAVSALYFYKNSKQPVVIDAETHTNISIDKCHEAVLGERLIDVWGFGFGCLLLSRKAFENHAFDYDLFGEERTDDFGYCHVLEQAGIKRYLDSRIICRHFSDPAVLPQEQGTRMPFTIK